MTIEARVSELEAKVSVLEEMHDDVKAIRSTMDQWKGGKNAILVVLGFTVPAFLGAVVYWLFKS